MTPAAPTRDDSDAPTPKTDRARVGTADAGEALSPKAARALACSQVYQSAADAPSTLAAYRADVAAFEAWCRQNGCQALPATPETVGAYLAAKGQGYALSTLVSGGR